MMKWPRKRYNDSSPEGRAMDESWNMAINACRAALDEACSRKALTDMINEALEAPITNDSITMAEEIADAIRRHLGLDNIK